MNNTDKTAAVSFSAELKQLSLEQLRDKESFLIDELLQMYDDLEINDSQVTARCLILNINKSLFKLDRIRNEIGYQQKTTMINSCNGIFQNLFNEKADIFNTVKDYGCCKHTIADICDCRCHR